MRCDILCDSNGSGECRLEHAQKEKKTDLIRSAVRLPVCPLDSGVVFSSVSTVRGRNRAGCVQGSDGSEGFASITFSHPPSVQQWYIVSYVRLVLHSVIVGSTDMYQYWSSLRPITTYCIILFSIRNIPIDRCISNGQ